MVLSIYGMIILAIGGLMLLLKRPLTEFMTVLLVCGVFGAAEAVSLPMLGGSSFIAPMFCVVVVLIRLLFAAKRRPKLFLEAIKANFWFIAFAVYAVAAAFLFSRLFEGQMWILPLRGSPGLLTFTSQNITQSGYVVLTVITAIAGYVAARSKNGSREFYRGWALAAALFAFFGIVDLVSFYAGLGELLDWLKTASYAMLSQSGNGIRRISGSFAEPSAFAGFGAGPATFFAFLWLVDVKPKLSGMLAILTVALLVLSTSTTAYATVAVLILAIGFGVVFTPLPAKVRRIKFRSLCITVFAAVGALFVIAFLSPDFATKFVKIAEANTVNKLESDSAIERGKWAAQGLEAFRVSKGLGVGPGSFRSSGVLQAIAGATGAFGVLCMLMYFRHLLRAAFSNARGVDRRMYVACGFATLCMMVPACLSAPSCDFGVMFGAMAGFTLGSRKQAILDARNLALAEREDRDREMSVGGHWPADGALTAPKSRIAH